MAWMSFLSEALIIENKITNRNEVFINRLVFSWLLIYIHRKSGQVFMCCEVISLAQHRSATGLSTVL